MGKLLERLKNQLSTDSRQDAEDCLKIYNGLIKVTGSVMESKWNILTDVRFKGWPSDERTYSPSKVGLVFLRGLEVVEISPLQPSATTLN
jgi:hypothetical protein